MTITILLKKSEIDYDIAMSTHVIMNRELAAGATEEQGFNYANTQDETGEVNLITRWVEKAISELAGGMARYLEDYTFESTNDLVAFSEVVFILNMPENFDKTLTHPLRSAMHDYVVNRTTYDWFMKAKPDEAQVYEKLFTDAYDKVKSLLNPQERFCEDKAIPGYIKQKKRSLIPRFFLSHSCLNT